MHVYLLFEIFRATMDTSAEPIFAAGKFQQAQGCMQFGKKVDYSKECHVSFRNVRWNNDVNKATHDKLVQ